MNKIKQLPFTTLYYAILLVMIVIGVDYVAGKVLQKLYETQKSGRYYRITYLLDSARADVFVFGSSMAQEHYVPAIISGETNLSCYNGGIRGQGLLFAKTAEEEVLSRCTPKIIILNIDPSFLSRDSVYLKRINWLLPYCKTHPKIAQLLRKHNSYLDYKLLSHIYPYNSTILFLMYFNFRNQKDYNGYVPVFGEMTADAVSGKPDTTSENSTLIPEYLEAFKSFIDKAKHSGAKLVCVKSPNFYGTTDNQWYSLRLQKQILKDNNIPLWDYSCDPGFTRRTDLFKDPMHLNGFGAEHFSKIIGTRIKSELLSAN